MTERQTRIASWKAEYARRRMAAERVRSMIRERVDAECQQAGVGSYHGCVVHNAMISLRAGKPWQDVDYSHLRRAVWLMEREFRASRLVDSWASRTMRAAYA